MEWSFASHVALPVGLGLLGFVEPCAIGSHMMVLGALYLQFRSFRLMFLTALPLLLGVVWALGGLVLAGHRISLLTVSILPVVLGIGIDDGIYVVNRYRSLRDGDVVHAFHDTGRAVVVTSLTTMVGFGSLILADYPDSEHDRRWAAVDGQDVAGDVQAHERSDNGDRQRDTSKRRESPCVRPPRLGATA